MHEVIIDGKKYIEETIADKKANILIYGYGGIDGEHDELYKAVERALGFKLFTWQKTFIESGTFRRLGSTTAEILKLLLDVDGEPLDYTIQPRCRREAFFRSSLMEIQYKLKVAGIPLRKVFWCKKDKSDYYDGFMCDKEIIPLSRQSHDGLRSSIFIVDEMHENKN